MNARTGIRGAWLGLALALAAILAPLLGGCAPAPSAEGVAAAAAGPPEGPQSPAPLPDLVAGNTAFALDLYHTLFDGQQNLVYAPHSLSAALAMTYAGARGETERQMAAALHFGLPQAELHPAFGALDRTLAPAENEEVTLYLANALWGQQGYPFLDTFRETIRQNYGAGLQAVDFCQAEEARRAINRWTEEQTRHGIEELLPQDSLDAETALVLSNAVYLKAAWLHPFDGSRTRDGAFTLADGTQVRTPMMEQVAVLAQAERPGVQAVELPYAGEALSMVLLVPEAGTFERFARGLDAAQLAALLGDLAPAGVRLAMPRFRFEATCQLKEALMGLGMVDAFGPADFSGMDGTRELFVDEVYHQVLAAVDEAGTEAAAAAAVVMALKGGPDVEQTIVLDRPFLFLVRDAESGAILFLGHVVNPAETS